MDVSDRLQQFSQAVQTAAAKLSSPSGGRLWVLVIGTLFAAGRRTVAAWLRAAELRQRWRAYYNFLRQIAPKINELAEIVFEQVSFHLRELPYLVFVLEDAAPSVTHGMCKEPACTAILPQVRPAMPFFKRKVLC
jgi:hypothetical protein